MSKQGFKERIISAAEKFILQRINSKNIMGEYHNRKKSNKAPYKRQPTRYVKKEIDTWVRAIMIATDPENPRKGELMRFFESIKLDLHLQSCLDTRIQPIQCAPVRMVNDKGEENKDATALLERTWYTDMIKIILSAQFEGTKLIQMFDLDESGELLEVVEVPQSNFIAQKGIIINEEYDDNGVSYKEGALKSYYVQIGNDWLIGQLNQAAMIIIAKKLGLGSWMGYIEKFGVPPLFAITDRMDDDRLDELYNMLESFRANHFAVLQGNERIEVPNNYNVDAYNSFRELDKMGNELLSKYFLGGSGITDEKSFVGSANIQEKMLMYKQKLDRLVWKFYFNREILPRLIQLSPIYSVFAGLKLEYDDKESLTVKEILEAVKELSQYYLFDINELVKITGLPLIAIKEAMNGATAPSTEKKKPSSNSQAMNITAAHHIYSATWDAAVENLANKIWNGEAEATDLDNDLVLKYYSQLNSAAELGWGDDYYDLAITKKFRNNLLQFSGAKSHELINELEKLRKNVESKEDFISAAKKKVNLFNDTYNEVEKKFAANSASSAREYRDYLDDADIYPNGKYRTMGDDAVRQDHAANEGIVKAWADWDIIPPLEPGCRCWIEQTTDPVTNGIIKQFNEKFSNNPVKSEQLFIKNHSYFENISTSNRLKVYNNTELLKVFIPYSRTIAVKEKKVFINDFSDEKDNKINIEAAKTLASELDTNIYLRPHINVESVKNPELGIGKPNTLGDLKTFDKDKSTLAKFIKNSIVSANKQGCEWVVLDLSIAEKNNNMAIIANKLRGDLSDSSNMNKNIKNVVIINGSKTIKITRKQINSSDYMKYFE